MAILDLETIALLTVFPLGHIAIALATTVGGLVFGGLWVRSALCAYLLWALVLDRESPYKGGYQSRWLSDTLRGAFFWKMAARYFPVSIKATTPLPPEGGPYVFVCHPHGIIGISPMTHFGTDATGFSKLFPGLQVHLLGHNAIFRIPFFREWCLLHGHGAVERRTCQTLLNRGHCIALAVGGAKESLECTPGTMRLYLRNRYGFARLSLQTGASLVPVLGFGENELFDTLQFKEGTRCRAVQTALQERLGFAMPLFYGRSWAPLLPKRLPVATVVGAPVRLEQSEGGPPPGGFVAEPSPELVAKLHRKYCAALQELFFRWRAEHGCADMVLDIV